MDYLGNLYAFDWEQTKSPAGATQWVPKDGKGAGMVPDAHDKSKSHQPIMFTTDLALKFDPEYAKVSKRFLDNPKEFDFRPPGKIFIEEYAKFIASRNQLLGSAGQLDDLRKSLGK